MSNITKELLSALLNKNVIGIPKMLDYSIRMHTPGIISANPAGSERYNYCSGLFYFETDKGVDSFKIENLAWLCANWLYANGYSVLYEKPNKTYRKVYLKKRDDENAKPFHPPYAAAHSDEEALIPACEYILKLKSKEQ